MEPPEGAFTQHETVTVETTAVEQGRLEKVARLGVVQVLTETFMIVEVDIPGYRRIHVVRYRTGDPISEFEGIAHLRAS